jgi:hypothetical protein
MVHSRLAAVIAFVIAMTLPGSAQRAVPRVLVGNPTPGTEQPAPPKIEDRVSLVGCVERAPGAKADSSTADPGEVSDERFILTRARRGERVPPGTGTSAAAQVPVASTYRLAAIDSALSPFVDMEVEISGAVEPAGETADMPPALRVDFVQKLAARCS